jgi:TolA-binding protein
LFQAGLCEEQLKQWNAAVKTYENLLQAFPDSEFASKAKSRIENARRKNTT